MESEVKPYVIESIIAEPIVETEQDKFIVRIGILKSLLAPNVVAGHTSGVEVYFPLDNPLYRQQVQDYIMQEVVDHFGYLK